MNSDPLIPVALRGFEGTPELKFSAKSQLESLLDQPSAKTAGHETQAAEAIARWDEVDTGKRQSFRRAFQLLAVAAAIASFLTGYRDISAEVETFSPSFNVWPFTGIPFRHRYSNNLASRAEEELKKQTFSPAERLLLFGDESQEVETDKRKALWESEPANPAYYSEYVEAVIEQIHRLPADYAEVLGRIDPDNARLEYLAAGSLASRAIEKKTLPAKIRGGPRAASWSVTNPKRLDEAVRLATEAARKSGFRNYQNDMLGKRLAVLRPSERSLSYYSAMYCYSKQDTYSALLGVFKCFAGKLNLLAADNDTAGFLELSKPAELFIHTMARSSTGTLIDSISLSSGSRMIYEELAKGATHLHLDADAIRWQAQFDGLDQLFKAKKTRLSATSDLKELILSRAQINEAASLSLLAVQVSDPPMLSEEELLPGCREDHSVAARVFAVWGSAFFMIAFLILGTNYYAASKVIRQLAVRFEKLLRPSDQLWIIGGGVIAPAMFVIGISRFTPLGGRDWNMQSSHFLVPTAHFVPMILLMTALPILIGRWRLRKRAACFGIASRKSWLGGSLAVAAILQVPLAGWMVNNRLIDKTDLATAGTVSALLLCWLAAVTFQGPFGSPGKRLAASTLIRALTPAYSVALLGLATMGPLFKIEQDYWFRQDPLVRFDPARPTLMPYEYQVSQLYAREIRKALGIEEF